MKIREYLAPFAHAENIVDEHRVLDIDVTDPRFAVSEGGLLQFTCGGDVIMAFTPAWSLNARPIVLVRDDREGEAWDGEAARGENPVAKRPRPFARLRLVPTA